MSSGRKRAPSVTADLALWKHWIRQLTNAMTTVLVYRDIWGMMAAAIDANPKIPRTLAMDYLAATYSQSQAVAVRRLVDTSGDVISLARLLESIAASPQLIRRDWWIGQFAEIDLRIAAQEWDANFGGTVGDHVDPQIVASDLNDLRAEADGVKTLVDKVVAHRVENYSGPLITQGDLNAALDHIGRLFQKYYKLLLVTDRIRLVPPDLKRVMATFSVPWV
jgi:hypothetical protein